MASHYYAAGSCLSDNGNLTTFVPPLGWKIESPVHCAMSKVQDERKSKELREKYKTPVLCFEKYPLAFPFVDVRLICVMADTGLAMSNNVEGRWRMTGNLVSHTEQRTFGSYLSDKL